ncbi:MAG TPA: hypothetical protein VNZ64_21720 [Candidatus Acidoferrum sp.]|nr:hypothetical protein [Candidatus Acidoferrum sp.]
MRGLAPLAALLKLSAFQSMPFRSIVFWSVGAAAFVMLPPKKFVEVLTLPPQASALNVCAVKAIQMQPNSSEMEKHGLAFMFATSPLICVGQQVSSICGT